MAHPVTHWPFFALAVRTPRLELRYPDDETVVAIADLAAQGIHDPAVMPFGVPWTDVRPPELERSVLRHHWESRAKLTADKWHLPLAVLVDGEVAGMQSIHAEHFAARRVFETGSWLGRAFQGRGLAKEMRAAVLHLGFHGLGAEYADTGAWPDNAASLAVTRSLPYEPNGEEVMMRRDRAEITVRFRMTRAAWRTVRRDDIEITGLEPCLPLLGLAARVED